MVRAQAVFFLFLFLLGFFFLEGGGGVWFFVVVVVVVFFFGFFCCFVFYKLYCFYKQMDIFLVLDPLQDNPPIPLVFPGIATLGPSRQNSESTEKLRLVIMLQWREKRTTTRYIALSLCMSFQLIYKKLFFFQIFPPVSLNDQISFHTRRIEKILINK